MKKKKRVFVALGISETLKKKILAWEKKWQSLPVRWIKGENLHMTLARFKPSRFSNFPIKTLNEKVFWQEKIDKFFLMESHLRKSGAEYDRIAEIPL